METAFNIPLQLHTESDIRETVIDINRFIPVGCLRIHRGEVEFPTEAWSACSQQWSAVAHPRDVYFNQCSSFLDRTGEECLMTSSAMKPFRALHDAQWIRLEFKTNDSICGQVRVYVLPEDVGHIAINRRDARLRKPMTLLMSRIDVSRRTWLGNWSPSSCTTSVDPSLDRAEEDEPSLFYIFNNLPSPKPEPDAVSDSYVRSAMANILASDVQGLQTTLYCYQRRSAALMLQREAQPEEITDPRLTLLRDQRGDEYHFDFSTSYCFKNSRKYEAARGGILAETMGLGKTLICLSLILATLEFPSQIPVEHSVDQLPVRRKTGSLGQMVAAAIGRSGKPWKSDLEYYEVQKGIKLDKYRETLSKEGGYYMMHPPPSRRESRSPITPLAHKIWLSTATIVIVPANLVQQWRQEIKKHTTGLDVLCVKDLKSKLPPAEELKEYGIILFSKHRFEKEFHSGGEPYHSPLRNIHFKRLIVDEGHTFGNASRTAKTEALTAVDSLHLTSKWIISGTPTQGLYGAEAVPELKPQSQTHQPSASRSLASHDFENERLAPADSSTLSKSEQDLLFHKQERKDLEKLGNIATHFLRARPWASTSGYEVYETDVASWSQLVMQPRHGSKSRGNMDCLKATLEGLIIRHRPDDVLEDVALPPLYRNIVKLEGSVQNKLSLNTFAMMIVTNAVASERKDADYFFHPRQLQSLMQLVSNLRSASFFWSGFGANHIKSTIDNGTIYLEKEDKKVTFEDEQLLRKAIQTGKTVLSNSISRLISSTHEMPFYIDNSWPDEARKAWSLNEEMTNPTLIGATFLHKAQQKIESQLGNQDPLNGLASAGLLVSLQADNQLPAASAGGSKKKRKHQNTTPALTGGVTVGDMTSSRPRAKSTAISTNKLLATADPEASPLPSDSLSGLSETQWPSSQSADSSSLLDSSVNVEHNEAFNMPILDEPRSSRPKAKSEPFKEGGKQLDSISLDCKPLESTRILSTASAKLSYLMDNIILYQADEKILVFYEMDNVAWYIAQALECLGIKHLIYAKSLSSARRSQYVVSFNQSPVFRVLLMDVSQAAFGLDISSASRVFFVNPVFSPQVEAQAVKRAHRIGQTRPVYVETLVLRDSIEEKILERRKMMSNEEHNRCKSILDDQTMYDWIKNVGFIDVDASVVGTEQMSPLHVKQEVIGRLGVAVDPDQDLILVDESPKGKGKRADMSKRKMADVGSAEDSDGKKVRFL